MKSEILEKVLNAHKNLIVTKCKQAVIFKKICNLSGFIIYLKYYILFLMRRNFEPESFSYCSGLQH